MTKSLEPSNPSGSPSLVQGPLPSRLPARAAQWSAAFLVVFSMACASSPRSSPSATPGTDTKPGDRATSHAGGVAPPAERPDCIPLLAHTEPEGFEAERRWLHENLPGWKKKSQALAMGREGGIFDRLEIETPDRVTHEVCFDISSWFGKW